MSEQRLPGTAVAAGTARRRTIEPRVPLLDEPAGSRR
ncbi:MAG: hypothetical protein JWP33_2849 [Blastococcus sp.]|jgi:hypothetical protein|nr:hypothetical protein [Blastococcus sp.]